MHVLMSPMKWWAGPAALEFNTCGPDRSPTEMLWNGLQRAVHTRRPPNVAELKRLDEEEFILNTVRV